MNAIKLLDEHTASRIAAGEVVERPVSVVKELVENSLDAGATAITVDISGGGIDKIRVTDNGSGIRPQDLRMAFERHATSKIASGDSLTDIGTLGFRGEALPSIAAVSRVTLTTRVSRDEAGARITVEGGKVTSLKEAGCPQGATILVEDLFFNTPARRKFLKRPSAEAALIADMMAQMALSRPELKLRFCQDGKTVFQTTGDGDILNAAATVLGPSVSGGMLWIDGTRGFVKLRGCVGAGDLARGSRAGQYISVNGRVVKPEPVYQGLETALRERVVIGRFPICVLHVQVPADALDVNCHPNKLEVRFANADYVRNAVYDIVAGCMQEHDAQDLRRMGMPDAPPDTPPAVPSSPQARAVAEQTEPWPQGQIAFSAPGTAPAGRMREPSVFAAEPAVNPGCPAGTAADTPPDSPTGPEPVSAPAAARRTIEYDVLGQAYGTYLLVNTREGLVIVDQHAAHERIMYDRLTRALDTDALSQKLLVGHIFDLPQRDKLRVLENAGLLAGLGFEVEDFGPTSVRVTAVPVILGEPQLGGFLADFVDRLDEIAQLREIPKKRERIITMACKSAIKAGDSLLPQEIESLLDQLFTYGTVPNCPHGRPILIVLAQRELERRFKRIV